jgi:hypothetical protein
VSSGCITSNRHIIGDVRDHLNDEWDLLAVMHPPCTRLCNSGVRWLSDTTAIVPRLNALQKEKVAVADELAAADQARQRDSRLICAAIWRLYAVLKALEFQTFQPLQEQSPTL